MPEAAGHPLIPCNCAHISPTMPTCRDTHLSSCPAVLLDFCVAQAVEARGLAADLPPKPAHPRKDKAAELRGYYAGYAYAMSIVGAVASTAPTEGKP